MPNGAEYRIGDHVVRFFQHNTQQIVQRRRLGARQDGTRIVRQRLTQQRAAPGDVGIGQLRFQNRTGVAGAILDSESQRQRFAALRQTAGQGVSVQIAGNHVKLTVLCFRRAARQRSYLAEHGHRVVRRHADKRQIARFLRAIERDGETVSIDNSCRWRGAKALRHIIPGPARRFVMAGEDGGIDQDITFNSLDAGFLQRGHHITNILTPKGRIAAKARNEVAFQDTAIETAFRFQRGGEAEVRTQLQQRSKCGYHLLGAGRKRHLLAMIVYLRRWGSHLLRHKGKVCARRKLVDVLVNIRRLSAKRYTGGQSDDKSGKSHNLALTA